MITKYLDPKNDLAFKKIFGQEKKKEIPISFLNAVFNLKGEDTIVDLEFLDGVQQPEIEARKESIVDVLVRDQKGTKYIIEMQVAKIEGFEKRAQYYAAKTYCSYFNVGNPYDSLKKVVFLAITSYEVFPNKKDVYKSDHVVLDRASYENDLQDFSFTFVELPKFNKTLDELETLEDKWYYFLKHAEESQSIAAPLKKSHEIQEAFHILERNHWSEAEIRNYERIAMAVADAQGAIVAAKKDGRAEGREEGRQEGRQEGLQEGIQEGIQEGMQRGIEKMVLQMLKNGMDVQQIAEMSGLDFSEVERLRQTKSI